MSIAAILGKARGAFIDPSPSGSAAILRSAILVAGLTVFVKLGALAKELLVANQFGRGDELDAFIIAFLLPSFAINVIAGGFNAAMIPTFVEVHQRQGRDEAQALLSNILAISTLLLVGVSLLLAAFSPVILPLLCTGFGQEKLELTQRMFYWLLPVLTIKGIASVWADTLNAGHRFALTSAAPVLNALGIVLALVFWGKVSGAAALAGGTVAGFILEAVAVGVGLRREGWAIMPRWHGWNASLGEVVKQYLPALASGVLMCSTEVIDSAMAATLPAGSVAALSYGNKISALVLGIGASSLATAALPHLSAMVAARNFAGLRRTLIRYLRLIILISLPVTYTLIVLSDEIVALIYQRGAFSAEDTDVVSKVQAAFVLQIPFYIASGFAVRVVSALKANHVVLWGTLLNVSTKLLFNYLFMMWFGVVGIALSTSLVYLLSFAYLVFIALKLTSLHEKGLR